MHIDEPFLNGFQKRTVNLYVFFSCSRRSIVAKMKKKLVHYTFSYGVSIKGAIDLGQIAGKVRRFFFYVYQFSEVFYCPINYID